MQWSKKVTNAVPYNFQNFLFWFKGEISTFKILKAGDKFI